MKHHIANGHVSTLIAIPNVFSLVIPNPLEKGDWCLQHVPSSTEMICKIPVFVASTFRIQSCHLVHVHLFRAPLGNACSVLGLLDSRSSRSSLRVWENLDQGMTWGKEIFRCMNVTSISILLIHTTCVVAPPFLVSPSPNTCCLEWFLNPQEYAKWQHRFSKHQPHRAGLGLCHLRGPEGSKVK